MVPSSLIVRFLTVSQSRTFHNCYSGIVRGRVCVGGWVVVVGGGGSSYTIPNDGDSGDDDDNDGTDGLHAGRVWR